MADDLYCEVCDHSVIFFTRFLTFFLTTTIAANCDQVVSVSLFSLLTVFF